MNEKSNVKVPFTLTASRQNGLISLSSQIPGYTKKSILYANTSLKTARFLPENKADRMIHPHHAPQMGPSHPPPPEKFFYKKKERLSRRTISLRLFR